MLENKDYCDYDTCVALKELGFDDVTHYNFNKDGVRTPRIPLYEAQKWLREEKKIYVEPYFAQTINHMPRFRWMVTNGNSSRFLVDTLDSREHYRSYEEALSEGIKEAVKILKEK